MAGVGLDDFLERMAGTPFVDGERDCALTLADWVMEARGCPDPAAHLRGRYSTARERKRLLRREGGLRAVIGDCAGRAGLELTNNPQRGDVGVIRSGRLICGAICLGERWAVKDDGWRVMKPDLILAAWRV